MLDSVKGDRCLENLVFRYCQDLELGDSHWRESMHDDKLLAGTYSIETEDNRSKSKQQIEEEKLLAENPNADVNLLWLQKKY